MDTHDEKIGYITGKLEEVQSDIAEIKDNLAQHTLKEDEVIDVISQRLSKIEHNMSLTVFVWRLIRAIGLTVAFILAFKFGDIGELWKHVVR